MTTSSPALSMTSVKSNRITSIDLLRGIVIIIMALDHVRDYFHGSAYLFDPTDLKHTSVPIFFTRWITHFCAPVFTFLAGTSAYLYGLKKGKKELSFFLFTRGLWLVFLEIFLITLEWTFNPTYDLLVFQVIWSIGASMIFLSILIYLPEKLILWIGVLIIFFHNALDAVHIPGNNLSAFLWALFHERNAFQFGHFTILVGYPVLPWLGIMMTGYCLGKLYRPEFDPSKRKKILLYLGSGIIILFIVIRGINIYGDPSHWSARKTAILSVLSFLRTTKYPPSLLYTLMTLGPSLVFLAFAEKPLNAVSGKISVFGRVSMFFYIIHIFLIHFLALIFSQASGYSWKKMILTTWVTDNKDLQGYGFNLITVYLIWIVVILLLYPLCAWYDKYKRNHLAEKPWLSYL